MMKKIIEIELKSADATDAFGCQLGRHLLPGDLICLDGSLGTGKTTMTQAIGRGLGVEEGYYINSPSFNILHEYPARLPLFHMDFYRLGGSEEVLDMGLDEYFFSGGVTVIEWASRAQTILPDERLEIYLEYRSAHGRNARLTAVGDSWVGRIETIASGYLEVG